MVILFKTMFTFILMGSGITKQQQRHEYYLKNYEKEFKTLKDIKKYFLYKDMAHNRINVSATLFTGRLVYK